MDDRSAATRNTLFARHRGRRKFGLQSEKEQAGMPVPLNSKVGQTFLSVRDEDKPRIHSRPPAEFVSHEPYCTGLPAELPSMHIDAFIIPSRVTDADVFSLVTTAAAGKSMPRSTFASGVSASGHAGDERPRVVRSAGSAGFLRDEFGADFTDLVLDVGRSEPARDF